MRLCLIVVVTDLRLSLSPRVPLGVSDRLESIAELTSLTLQTEVRVWQDRASLQEGIHRRFPVARNASDGWRLALEVMVIRVPEA